MGKGSRNSSSDLIEICKPRLAQGKQNLRAACLKCKLEFKFFFKPWISCLRALLSRLTFQPLWFVEGYQSGSRIVTDNLELMYPLIQ